MTNPIAVVGIATQLPSGNYSDKNLDHESFFEFLLNYGEAYERIPPHLFNISEWKGKGVGRLSVDTGAFLKGVDLFDNIEFGVAPKDARTLAPSTRKMLETSFLALLDSGIDYRTRNVGCYTSGVDWESFGLPDDDYDSLGSFAGYPAMVANKVSYHLDMLGPSVPTDTACSSSLTAMHLAVQAVRAGECEAAVVAGSQLNHRLAGWLSYSAGEVLAKDGKCKPFDASANGFSRGEGVVAVVIKPLEDALRDHDRIYATILGTGISSGGNAATPNAPIAEAQCAAMKRAFKQAERNPQDVDFVECHATGTGKGDPTEANWIGEQFMRDDDLLVGSVKGNVGHLEITAFLASLSKVLSIFEHGVVPPNVNFKKRNPAIKWDKYRLRVPLEPTPLSSRLNGKSMIAMASAGIGGATGHIVLESPPIRHALTADKEGEVKNTLCPGPVLLMAGGLSPRSVSAIAESVTEIAGKESQIQLLSTVLGRRARQMTWRSFSVVEQGEHIPVKFSQPILSPRIKPPIVFVFCGQGPQHRDMGRELFRDFHVFRDSILEMDETYAKVTGSSLVKDYGLFHDESKPTLELTEPWSIAVVIPAVVIYQVALFDLLVSLGVKPDVVIGHSAGENAVSYACGAASKAMVVELAIARGKAYASLEDTDSTMAAISCSPREAQNLINEARRSLSPEDVVEIACLNSPTAVTLGGKNKAIDRVMGLAEDKGVWCRKIRTRTPNHTSLMEGCRELYCRDYQEIFERYPGAHVPSTALVYSTVTGKPFTDPFDAEYFWTNARGQVHFTEAVQSLVAAYPSLTLVEIAPHPVLSSYVSSMVGDSSSILCVARRPKKGEPLMEHNRLLNFLGEITALGHNCVDFTALNGRACYEGRVSLPPYPFVPKAFPLYLDAEGFARQLKPRNGPLNHSDLRVSKETHPSLAEHIIRGESIMPAAGFLEMAIEFKAPTLFNVNLRSILPLPTERPTKVMVELDGSYWTVKSIASSHGQSSQMTTTHADGYLSFAHPKGSYPPLDLAEIRTRCQSHHDSVIYPLFDYFSSYGPLFQRIVNVSYNSDEALALIKGTDDILMNDADYYLHPTILDACFQLVNFKPVNGNYDPNAYYLPSRVGALLVHRPLKKPFFPERVLAHLTFKNWTPEAMQYDIDIVDGTGERLCTLESFEVQRHLIWAYPELTRRFTIALQPVCHPARPVRDEIVHFEGEDTSLLYDVLDRCALQAQGIHSHILPDGLSDPRPAEVLDVGYTSSNGTLANVHAEALGPVDEEKSPISERMRLKWAGHSELKEKQFSADKSTMDSLQLKWPEKFEMIAKREAEAIHDTSPSLFDLSPHLDSATVQCVTSMRSTLSSLAQDGNRRLIRLLVMGDSVFVTNHLLPLLAQFPSLFVDVFSCNSSEPLDVDPQMGVSHIGKFDLGKPLTDQKLEPNSFDIIVDFNALPADVEVRIVVERFEELLVPSGCLVMTEKNKSAWEYHRPGTAWYNFVFGAPAFTTMVSMDVMLQTLDNYGFSPLTVSSNAEVDPFHFTVECQKSSPKDVVGSAPLYDESESFTFEYCQGQELDFQWAINGLDPLQKLDIWVVTTEGKDGDVALGLIRALRREMLEWTIRLVIFPASFASDVREETLRKLPECVRQEPELFITPHGDILVPRMAPMSPPSSSISSSPTLASLGLPDHHVLVRIKASYKYGFCSSFVACIERSSVACLDPGVLVVGLSDTISNEYLMVDEANLALLPSNFTGDPALLVMHLAGYAAAVIAPSQSIFNKPGRLGSLRILLTHSNTLVGRAVSHFYAVNGTKITGVTDDIDILGLSKLGLQSFDIIISGYVRKAEIQVMRTLLCGNRGKLFSWNDEDSGLLGILKKTPWMIGDALRDALGSLKDTEPLKASGIFSITTSVVESSYDIADSSTSIFKSGKTYLLIGGIGCLGAQIALWMYQRGARHIIATSRQGRNSLHRRSNLMAKRIFQYLDSCSQLHIRLENIDATAPDGMKSLIGSIQTEIGGCVMLAGLSSDRLFVQLSEEDFTDVFAPKVTSMEVLTNVLDIERLDFLVALTSASGTFGIGGQTNYAAANSALDGLVARYPNAFSLSAPAVFDSGFLLTGGMDAKSPALNHIVEWAMSAEDITRWLEDGIHKILDGHKFNIYIPDLNWTTLDRTLGMPKMGKHLVPTQAATGSTTVVNEVDHMATIVMKILSIPREEFSYEVPFTSYGLDSLTASRLAYSLHSIVEVTQIQLLANMTFEDLMRRLAEASEESGQDNVKSGSSTGQAQIDAMIEMLAKYTKDFPRRPTNAASDGISPLNNDGARADVILLTGTTGVLGVNILAQLIESPDVKRVYALNRSSKGHNVSLMERQLHILEDQGLPLSYAESEKLILVEGDTSSPNFSITDDLMDELLSSVTHIIHNAWLVDINAPLPLFENAIKGTRQLVDFALNSKLADPPALLFISTIGVYRAPKEAVIMPEEPIEDPSVSATSGYPESKWIAEHILHEAASSTPLRTVVVRVGQMSGAVNGAWNPIQWVPLIVKSGLSVGCLPSGNDNISWLPIHLGAAAAIEMREAPTGVLHVAHPQPVTWDTVFEPLASLLDVPLVPYADWFARLEKGLVDDGDKQDPDATTVDNPALKLIDFFRTSFEVTETSKAMRSARDSMGLLPGVALEKSQAASKTLRDEHLPQLGQADAEKWVNHWREIGFLPPA